MRFDARTASKLPAGQHMTFDGFPGLRFQASESRRSWIYRYKSPIDDRMRQVKLGEWPAMGFPAAISEWEQKRAARDAGADPAAAKREKRAAVANSRAVDARLPCFTSRQKKPSSESMFIRDFFARMYLV